MENRGLLQLLMESLIWEPQTGLGPVINNDGAPQVYIHKSSLACDWNFPLIQSLASQAGIAVSNPHHRSHDRNREPLWVHHRLFTPIENYFSLVSAIHPWIADSTFVCLHCEYRRRVLNSGWKTEVEGEFTVWKLDEDSEEEEEMKRKLRTNCDCCNNYILVIWPIVITVD